MHTHPNDHRHLEVSITSLDLLRQILALNLGVTFSMIQSFRKTETKKTLNEDSRIRTIRTSESASVQLSMADATHTAVLNAVVYGCRKSSNPTSSVILRARNTLPLCNK